MAIADEFSRFTNVFSAAARLRPTCKTPEEVSVSLVYGGNDVHSDIFRKPSTLEDPLLEKCIVFLLDSAKCVVVVLDHITIREFYDVTVKHCVGHPKECAYYDDVALPIEGKRGTIVNDDVALPIEGTKGTIVNEVKSECMDEDGMIILYSSCHTENDTGYTLSYYTMGSTRYW